MLLRVLLVLVTVIVYTVAWYGDMWGAHPKYEYGTPVTVKSNGTEAGYSTVLYEEGFVNSAKAGTVSHVSTIAPISNGRIVAAWYSGSREGAKDVSIFSSVYDPFTRLWSKERVIVTRAGASKELGRYIKKLGNPVLFTDSADRLWLVYVTVSVGGWSGSSLNYKLSLDEGKSWSSSKKLITSPFFNISTLVKNKPVQLDNGALLLPTYHELLNKLPELLFVTPDGNGLYVRSKRAGTVDGVFQGALLVTKKRALKAFYRNATGAGQNYVLTSTSIDTGKTWSKATDTVLPNPNSGLDVVWAEEGRALIVLNDTFSNRARLALYYSVDSGSSWQELKVFEDAKGREFSYPYIIRTTDGFYHLTYTYGRERIKHITFSEAWLKKAADNG